MDDLLDNFGNHDFESPTEEDYIYHFVNGTPPPLDHDLDHDRPIHPAPAAPTNKLSFFHLELHQAANDVKVDEGDYYNADIDDEDDDFERERDPTSRSDALDPPASDAINGNFSLLVNNTTALDRSFRHPNRSTPNVSNLNSGNESEHVKPALAITDDEPDMDDFKQHLRRLHRQDFERDELLTQLYQENLDLKRILKESVPGSNSRAEAAERSLFEIRKSLDNSPYVCVLIDGKGYKIHEDLLQLGKQGGLEAADRLRNEVSFYLQQFGEAKNWEIMVHLYVDVGGLLARCVSNDIPLSDSCLRGFTLGFTQAQPLFIIVDVGHDHMRLARKVEAMFNLFANNTQCKHLIFGCCHDASYVAALEKYAFNPITASSITLLKSYEISTFFQGLPFDSVEFPSVFRSTPYKITDRLAEDIDDTQNLPQQLHSDRTSPEAERHSVKEVAGANEAIAKWQATADAAWPVLAPARHPAKAPLGWVSEKKVLLNINDERVDQELGEIDHKTLESMLDRMEMQRFCLFYHLQDSCVTNLAGKPCNFRHGPRLTEQEFRFLKRSSQLKPCTFGPRCRRPDCLYGHVCPNQPGCEKGPNCPLYRLHEVEKTAVRVWTPEKRLSPPKGGWRV